MTSFVSTRSAWLTSLSLVSFACGTAAAQPDQESCTFRYQSPETGQRIWQHVTTLANLTTTHEQFGQKISQENRTISQEQIRRLEILELQRSHDDAAIPHFTRVRVEYEKAQKSAMQNGVPPKIEAQPVEGQTYVVWRQDGELQVTREDGEEPSMEETAIVRRNMQAIGRANPLAQFLQGRTVSVGDRLEMPSKLAGEMLGWQPEYGQLQQAILELSDIRDFAGIHCGIFRSQLTGAPVLGSPVGTQLTGDIYVEISTCRTVSADIKSRLHSREERGPAGNTFFVNHRGQASLHMQSRFLKIRR